MPIYVSDKLYVFVCPVQAERQFLDTLKIITKEVGVPISLIADPARAQKSMLWFNYVIRLVLP